MMATNDEKTFYAFIARKVSGQNFRFKKRKGPLKDSPVRDVKEETDDISPWRADE